MYRTLAGIGAVVAALVCIAVPVAGALAWQGWRADVKRRRDRGDL